MAGTIVEEDAEGESWWEAEKVVDSRLDALGRKEYKIRWVGFSKKDDTWEPEENLANSLYKLAKEYEIAKNIVEEDAEGASWWEAEKVVDSRLDTMGRKEYKIRWVGYGKKDDTWEPEENLADSLYKLAEEYDKKLPQSKRKAEPSNSKPPPSKRKKSESTLNDRAPWTIREGTGKRTSLFSLGHLSVNALCHRLDKSPSFATYFFGKRVVSVEVPFQREATVPPKVAKLDGYTLELLSSHFPTESVKAKNGFVQNAKNVRFTYVATSGPDLPTISLKETLESIANFGSLSPHKAKARLELLESGTNEDLIVSDLKVKDFTRVAEKHNLGCGFIPIDMLTRILDTKSSAGMCIIQVRIISPRLGVFKGVLCPKRDITKIELPTSMRKVGPSMCRKEPANNWVCLIVKNIFPTQRNVHIGRELDATSVPSMWPFSKRRAPGEMVERLWQGLGVSSATIKKYARRCKAKDSIAGLKHAYLVGVIDPTGQMPKGHVFLPGMGREQDRDKVFMTRSPCVETSDGRLVPVVTAKPKIMSASNWRWINSFPFGIVVFALPREQTAPLPQLIASGDLDGDCYFVCWDDEIVEGIPNRVRPVTLKVESKIVSKPCSQESEDWLSSARDVMLDVASFSLLTQLKGRLWGAAKRSADGSDLFMNDRMAIQFARAYKLSLDLPKHGGKLRVPDEVREGLPKSLHTVLSQSRRKSPS